MTDVNREKLLEWQRDEISQRFRHEITEGIHPGIRNQEDFLTRAREEQIIDYIKYLHAEIILAEGAVGVCNFGVKARTLACRKMLSRDLSPGEMDFIIAFCGIDHPPISYDTAMTLFGITEDAALCIIELLDFVARNTHGLWRRKDLLALLDEKTAIPDQSTELSHACGNLAFKNPTGLFHSLRNCLTSD